jgi:branched-chain amino acid transport system substrate-binding protein
VYAVQGYDAAQILAAGLNAVKGDLAQRDALTAAMRKTSVDSPRGKFTLSAAGNPVQDIYVREVKASTTNRAAWPPRHWPTRRAGCKL